MWRLLKERIDWVLIGGLLPIFFAGLVTMKSFTGEGDVFLRQLLWIAVSLIVLCVVTLLDARVLKRTALLVGLFSLFSIILIALFAIGKEVKGAQSWFDLGGFSFQPSDMMKLVVVLMLAKYFSRRHIEIAHLKHLVVSGLYAFIPFFLVFLQPDFGSAIIIFLVWFGMILVSGVSRKHLLVITAVGLVIVGALWLFVFEPYQKARIMNFVHPIADVQGTGYNAYQSLIAVGSGQIFGKGLGYGTQSRLNFLPEYKTDFIFAAFAEEWGFVGTVLLLLCYGVVIWRIIINAIHGATNFEMLYGFGIAILFLSHIIINVGMNIGIMPVTGITLPFMSYGGSHLVTEAIAIGILFAMRGYNRPIHRDDMNREFFGLSHGNL